MNYRIKMTAAFMLTLLFVTLIALAGVACEETAQEVEAERLQVTGKSANPHSVVLLAASEDSTLSAEQVKSADKPAAQQRNGSAADLAEDARPAWTTLRCRIVHYCECDRCTGKHEGDPAYGVTATGTRVTEGRTVAVDPDVIPLGSELLINGHSYTAEDTGVKGSTVDIYIPDHEQALRMGTYETLVMWR